MTESEMMRVSECGFAGAVAWMWRFYPMLQLHARLKWNFRTGTAAYTQVEGQWKCFIFKLQSWEPEETCV